MNELAAQLLASTVVAAAVSAIALIGREVVAARAGRRASLPGAGAAAAERGANVR
jgi:hypothetical protein